MALIKFGGGVIQASGSIAGTTYARNRFGNYSRSRTKPVNPQSAGQNLIRSSLAYLSQYWGAILSSEQRGAWATFAASVPSLNRLGEQVYLTGFNQFLKSNIVRLQAEQTIIQEGPTVLTLPETDPTFAVTADANGQSVSVAYDANLPWVTDTGARMHVYMGQPQNATRNFFGGPYKYMGSIEDGGTGTEQMTPPYTLTEGQKVWFYARIQRSDGRLSGKFRSSGLVVNSTP